MPRVRFTADFDFKPKASVTLAFRAGDEQLVTTPCADAAVAAGKGEIVDKTAPALSRKGRKAKPNA